MPSTTPLTLLLAAAPSLAHGQENYEIQVYGSQTMPVGSTMFELHSNYALDGRRTIDAGMLPTNHALHERVEITHGFTSWFEVGGYLFSSTAPGQSWRFVGSHVRPRVRAPDSWHWPVGASLSMEVGYQERDFSQDSWTMELRPIIDKHWVPGTRPSIRPSVARSAATTQGRDSSSRPMPPSPATSRRS
jgi:hypothetical protein